MTKATITVIGDTTLDLISQPLKSLPREDTEAHTQFTPKLGGQAAHCALALAKLGIKTQFFTCLGNDPLAQPLIKKLKQKNLQLHLQKENRTALSLIALTKHKRTVFNDPGANALFQKISLKKINTPYLFLGGPWHLKKLNLIRLLKHAKSKNIIIFTDFGWHPHPNQKLLRQLFQHSDYLFLDKKELLLYTRQKTFPQALKKIKTNLALHLGPKGSLFYSKNKTTKAPAKKIYHGDTTGAGDFWNAGFIYGLIQHWPIKKTLTFANHFAIQCLRKKIHHL